MNLPCALSSEHRNSARRSGSTIRRDAASPTHSTFSHRASSSSEDGQTKIKVCIRVRPPESGKGDNSSVTCSAQDTLVLTHECPSTSGGERSMEAKFDHVLPCDASQALVYDVLGRRFVEGMMDGFNGCALAYGQTGSGKSHTVFGGLNDERGLLPRIAEDLFEQLKANRSDYLVKVSYLEIYNEKVRDLLNPSSSNGAPASLEIRRHPKVGVFVEGLTQNVAEAVEDVNRLLEYGHKIRVVGTTNMNAVSSRSHAVVTLHVEQTMVDGAKGYKRSRRAELHAVDLAGCERTEMSGSDARQKESKQINKSLLALSLTISRLADQERSGSFGDAAGAVGHVPYRNSKLTYLLSNALMGNCRTVLLACISPNSKSYAMTESTIRFASSAKKVRTQPTKNEEADGNLVSSLRAEIEVLRQQLSEIGADQKRDVIERMATAQLLHSQFSSTKEELQAQSVAFATRRQQILDNLGLSNGRLASAVARGETVSVRNDADPYLVNVCDDPLLSGCLMYALPRGRVVRMGSSATCAIRIDGLGIQPETCSIVCHDGSCVEISVRPDSFACSGGSSSSSNPSHRSSSLTKWRARAGRRGSLFKNGITQVLVNNKMVEGVRRLRNKDRLRVGRAHVFQLFVPQERKAPADVRMTRLVDEIALESYGGQLLAKEYAGHLKDRIGGERAVTVFTALQEVKLIVDEANDLTEELRGGEEHELVFKAHVLTDVTSVDHDPEIMVALHLEERPDEIGDDGTYVFQSGSFGGKSVLAAVWSVQQFQQRLEVMRDLYHEVGSRDDPWGLPGDLDPWQDRGVIPCVGADRWQDRFIPCSEAKEPKAQHNEVQAGESALARLSVVEAEQQRMHSELVAQLMAIGMELEQTRAEREALLGRVPNLEQELHQAHARIAATDATCQQLEANIKHIRTRSIDITERRPYGSEAAMESSATQIFFCTQERSATRQRVFHDGLSSTLSALPPVAPKTSRLSVRTSPSCPGHEFGKCVGWQTAREYPVTLREVPSAALSRGQLIETCSDAAGARIEGIASCPGVRVLSPAPTWRVTTVARAVPMPMPEVAVSPRMIASPTYGSQR